MSLGKYDPKKFNYWKLFFFKLKNSKSIFNDELSRLHMLEQEQEQLNSSLMALTTHFAQVQFRLKQIVTAPGEEKEVNTF